MSATHDKLQKDLSGEEDEVNEFVFKVMVVGNATAGKTALIQRIVQNEFLDNYKTTIGVDFAMKSVEYDEKTVIRLQLWDIAGQERFGRMTRVYYKEAVGAFVVFDVTQQSTFDIVNFWKEDIDEKVALPDGSRIPCILLANKIDLVQNPDNFSEMGGKDLDEYCKENGFGGWVATSAKDGTNTDIAVRNLVNKIFAKVQPYQTKFHDDKDEDILDLEEDSVPFNTDSPKRRCC
eukprot:TRINITY_DN7841_c0_g1_i1.p2 TRINITY_DN7841_c0_g1~~TRINITY_DN7841_c0_g1_i1.p2  ORF type:complete len:234 (-),score=48.54 TRINITY_DN7841_c0_g1_i1:829-1530(-)